MQSEVSLRRRSNLLGVLAQPPPGTKKRLGEAMGWSAARISQKLAPPQSAGYRSISAPQARRFESVLGLAQGSLDQIEPDRMAAELNRTIENLERVGKAIRRGKSLRNSASVKATQRTVERGIFASSPPDVRRARVIREKWEKWDKWKNCYNHFYVFKPRRGQTC